jgi:hypothetical protein
MMLAIYATSTFRTPFNPVSIRIIDEAPTCLKAAQRLPAPSKNHLPMSPYFATTEPDKLISTIPFFGSLHLILLLGHFANAFRG